MATNGSSSQNGTARTPQGSPLPCKLQGLDGSVTLLEMLDSGSYGKVFLAKTSEGKLRAAKCVPLRTDITLQASSDLSPESEAGFLKLVKHRNVIRLHDSRIVDGRLWISMEYARFGNINTYMHNDGRKKLSEAELAIVANSILSALKTVHKKGVMHRDVKPNNILITQDGTVKLGDMGTACMAVTNRHSVQGTFQYLAPEIFSVQAYDGKVDIWALGMTLLELAQGFNPFQSEHFARVLYHLVDSPSAPSLADPSLHSSAFIDFLSRMLTLQPEERESAIQLLKHPFLKKVNKTLPIESRLVHSNQVLQVPSSLGVPSLVSSSGSNSSSNSKSSHTSASTSSSPYHSMSSCDSGSMRSNGSDDSEELTSIKSIAVEGKRSKQNAIKTKKF